MRRACLAAILVLACAHSAAAQSRVVVRPFKGTGATRVRAAVVQGLGKAHGMQTVSNSETESAADSLGADLTHEAGRVAVARKLSLSAFVEGDVEKHGASTEVSLRVYDGRDGTLLVSASLRARHAAIHGEVKKRVLSELGAALARAQPPSAEPAPEAPALKDQTKEPVVQTRPAPVIAATPEPEEPSKRLPHALELGAAVRVSTRSYSYGDALLKLGEHILQATPALRVEVRWYPAAHFTSGFASNLGLDLYGQMMWPVDSEKGSTAFKTTSTALGIAARLRIPLAAHQLGISAGYGGQSLAIADAGGQDPGVPSVAYGFVRLGADGRFMLGRALFLGVRAAYLLLTGFGELGQAAWFPHVGGGGLEAELSLGYEFSELVALNLGGGMTRYFMSLEPELSDPGVQNHGRIAGGLIDQYLYGVLGVTLRP
jgi:hypothetical protein